MMMRSTASPPPPNSFNALQLLDSYLGRAAAAGLITGGGTAALNAMTEPEYYVDAKGRMILDAEGNPIVKATNDADPVAAGLTGVVMGLGSKALSNKAEEMMRDYYRTR